MFHLHQVHHGEGKQEEVLRMVESEVPEVKPCSHLFVVIAQDARSPFPSPARHDGPNQCCPLAFSRRIFPSKHPTIHAAQVEPGKGYRKTLRLQTLTVPVNRTNLLKTAVGREIRQNKKRGWGLSSRYCQQTSKNVH